MPYDFEHGNGTANDPYLIATEADFWGIFDVNSDYQPNFVGNYFRQTADITITQSVSINTLTRCVYDGNNHRISGFKPALAYLYLETSTWKNSIFLNCTNEGLGSGEYPTVFRWICLEEEGVGENKLDNIQLLNSPGIYIFAGSNIVATNLIVKNSGGFAGGMIEYSKISECYGENLAFTQSYYATGAFCDVFGCSFENIVIRNVEYEDELRSAGGMVGETYYSNFKNCVVLGAKVIGENSSGGFAGEIYSGTFEDCFALGVTVEVRPRSPNQLKAWQSGGFAGGIFATKTVGDPDYVPFVFRRCIVHGTVDVDARYSAGGFAGAIMQEKGSFFEQCGAEVSVINANENAGGFVGEIWGSLGSLKEGAAICKDCYALGDSVLSNLENAISNGGFVGVADSVIFERCFSKGLVSGGTSKGGFCGWGYDIECIDCYYDSETSGQSDTSMGTPKTTAEMKTQLTFPQWNFINTWKIGAFAGGEKKSLTGNDGSYEVPVKDGTVMVYLEFDPSEGYPYLQFETKKQITKSGRTKCDWYVRGSLPE